MVVIREEAAVNEANSKAGSVIALQLVERL